MAQQRRTISESGFDTCPDLIHPHLPPMAFQLPFQFQKRYAITPFQY